MEEEMLEVFRKNNKQQKEDMKIRKLETQIAILETKREHNIN